MASHSSMEFRGRPSVLAYMLRALYPSPGMRDAVGVPPLRARWRDHRLDGRRLGLFLELTGLRADEGVPMLYLHVLGFPLLMAVLTHPRFPLPIWNVLQIRNHLLQHQPINTDAVLDQEARVVSQRILEKGVEFDFHTTVSTGGDLVWESLNTFYFRGRYGKTNTTSPLARAPQRGDTTIARWRTPSGSGWRFAGLTGDYNGIHYWPWYARRFGFQRDILHPQRALGQCLARLGAGRGTERQRLDAWLKGPVYYDTPVSLVATAGADRTDFGLMLDGEERPAILGMWRSAAGAGLLLDETDRPVGPDER